MTYEEAVSYINDIPKFTKKTTLDHTRRILDVMGHPERDLKVIHVAGTNGKGSVCAYLNSMLMLGGYTCGLFTSPHLERINERFMINNVQISDDEFLEAFEEVMKACKVTMDAGETHPTYFETIFLMGVWLFRKHNVDYLILETGLGGRLDATNVTEHPLACIITSISRDHTEYLGETIPEIAAEKAGIIKPGVPVICDGKNEEAAAVITAKARELGSPAYVLTPASYELISTMKEGTFFRFRFEGQEAELSVPSVAEYQMMNASLAYFAMKLLAGEHGIADEVLREGIRRTVWPCRMETVMEDVVIDGAHNEDGVARFVETVSHFGEEQEITLLFSAVADKRYPDMIRELCEGIRPARVVVTQIAGSREVSAERLAQIFRSYGCEDVTAVAAVGEAFDTALAKKGDGMLFCVGSLYLAGELKTWIAEHYPRTR